MRNSEEKTVRVTALQQDSDQWMFGGESKRKAKEKSKRRERRSLQSSVTPLPRAFIT